MSHCAREHLRLGESSYDDAIRRFIPGYSEMVAAAAGAVAAVGPRLALDVGAGTGALAEALLERSEIEAVELLDVDAEMLDQARRRLQRFGDRARFTLRSYDEPLPRCDAVAASLALHHMPDLDTKAAFFARAFDALRPAGILVNADVNMPADGAERDRLYRYWADHLVASGIAEERAWRFFAEWSEEDTYLPLDDELAALARIGFAAERVWENGPVGVVAAAKP